MSPELPPHEGTARRQSSGKPADTPSRRSASGVAVPVQAAWYRRAWAHADATFDALGLDAVGQVPWWGAEVTLHRVMLHVVVDIQRHAGHADIVRELIDGATGLPPGNGNMPPRTRPAGRPEPGGAGGEGSRR